jgi:hypothetical protein
MSAVRAVAAICRKPSAFARNSAVDRLESGMYSSSIHQIFAVHLLRSFTYEAFLNRKRKYFIWIKAV